MKRLYYKITELVAWALMCTSLASCYYVYSVGDLTHVPHSIVDSTHALSTSYAVAITSYPTRTRADLSLKVMKSNVYPIEDLRTYHQLRAAHAGPGWASLLLGGAMAYGSSKLNTRAPGAKIVRYSLLAGGAVIVIAGLTVLANSVKVNTGKLVDSTSIQGTEASPPTPMPFTPVIVSSGKLERFFTTDADGAISVDLVRDLSLGRFDRPRNVHIVISSPKFSLSRTIALNSRNWTTEFFQVQVSTAWVFSKPSPQSERLSKVTGGSTLRVLEQEPGNWLKVKLGSFQGWIPEIVGKTFWAAGRSSE